MFESTARDDGASLVPPWTPVLDLTGQTIGSIAEEPPEDGYLPVYKGLFFPKLIYIPRSYVSHTDSYGVHLSLCQADLGSELYADPKSAVAFSTC